MTRDHEALTAVEREALRSRVERNWPFEVDDTTADEIRDIADGVAVEVEHIIAELLTEIRRLRRGNHPAGRARAGANPFLAVVPDASALQEACEERDTEHEGGEGA